MDLQNIQQTLLPRLLKLNFGTEIFKELEKKQHILVKGVVGSASSLLVAKYFLTLQNNILYVTDEKENAH